MDHKRVVDEISSLVEEACKNDSNMFGYGIWSHHIVYVAAYARQLAVRLGTDEEIAELAALLHDYAGIRDSSLHEEHHIHGASEAQRLLSGYGYPQDKIDKVKQCIISHRGSVAARRSSPEEECIASADAMAHILQVASLLHLAYVRHGMGIEEGKAWVLKKIDRSWNKLCPEAKEIIKDDYMCVKRILE